MATHNTDLDINRYVVISKIGEGNFSKVYRVKDQQDNEYYAAKVAKFMINEDMKDSEEVKSLFREVNLMSLFNHPSILKFIGYYSTNFEGDPVPSLITELASNGSLRYLIELETSGLSPSGWDSTKKLINIYGIASGMSYLHKHNVLHRDLKPENILIDDYLHPKIVDFGLSKLTDFLSASINYQSQRGAKGTPAYMSPEILRNEEYSKAGDVYAFGFIVYEIMTGEIPYKNDNIFKLLEKIIGGSRPTISSDVPDSYRELIENCWAQDACERPSFDYIVSNLRENSSFITETTDEIEFFDYVDFIDKYQSTFDISKRVIHFSDFIESKGRKKVIQKFTINKTDYDSNSTNLSIQNKSEKSNENKSTVIDISQKNQGENEFNEKPQKIDENKMKTSNKINEIEQQINPEEFIYPLSEFNELTKSCRALVDESKTDPSKQFIVGKSLIEGTNEFPKNITLGVKYIEESVKHNFIESIIYYCELLIKGDIIAQDLQKSKEYLSNLSNTQDGRVFLMQGKISYKEKQFKASVKYFEDGVKIGDKACMYEYGKMYFLGEGIKKNDKECLKYMNKSKELGHLKAEYFLRSYYILKQIKEFNSLPSETQMILINSNIKNISKPNSSEFDQLFTKPLTTEKLFYNKSLASSNFLKCLAKYKKITIELEYQTASFAKIIDLVVKIQNRKIKYIKIGIVFSSLTQPIPKSCFSENISYHTIDKSIRDIPSEAFKGCTLKNLTISSSVTSIGNEAFYECSSLMQISIPSSVTSIGDYAFYRCSSLTQISIPSSVTSIGNHVFYECSSLTQISIPSSVTSIKEYSFYECSSLTQISIPSSVTSIGDYAFYRCLSLTQISIPSSVTSIGDYAFYRCLSLTQISIPSSATSIGNHVFYECSSLTQISIPSSVTSIGDYAFYRCSKLKQISIPSSVTSIGGYTFYQCFLLTEVSIPSSVTSIGDYAFYKCSKLTQISIPSSVTSIGNSAFYECSSLTQISIPSSITSIGHETFCGCSSLTQISIPSSVTSIGEYAFYGCSKLTEISIPSSLTSIKEYSFYECSSLTQISIPSSVTSIGDYAFYRCLSLTQISIPSSVISIGNYVFIQCSKLTEISIPSSITSIGNETFFGCSSLTKISIPSSVTEIRDSAFEGCSSLTEISIPSSVTKIGNNTFSGCSRVTQISIPSSATEIGNHAFYECSSLAQISIPSSVTSIGNYSFSGCSSLKKVLIVIPSSVTSIGSYTFSRCSLLTQISIPSSVTSIGNNAFRGCSSLNQISFDIPSSLTSIRNEAFCECSSLTQITIPSSVNSIGNHVFYECSSLTQIIILSSVISIGNDAFFGCRSLKQISIPSSLNRQFSKIKNKVKIVKI